MTALHVRKSVLDLGCFMCDEGHPRICFENPLSNPVHLYGTKLLKCLVPDAFYELEREQECIDSSSDSALSSQQGNTP